MITANADATIGVGETSQTLRNGIFGTQGVIKRGGGTLTVLGDNTGFTGTITVKEGTLALSGGSIASERRPPVWERLSPSLCREASESPERRWQFAV